MDDEGHSAPRRTSRRSLLALVGAGLTGSLAGCGGSDDPTATARPSATPGDTPPTATPARTTKSRTSQRTTETTATDAETPTDTDTPEQETDTPEQSTETATPVEPSGPRFGPTDGFADAAWLDDDAAVVRVREPTADALESAIRGSGPRVVVFETSGTIDLQERRLRVTDDRCWIAGQTAPSPGITLIRGDLWIDADDCVVQHLRVRPGDAGNDGDWEPDTVRTADGTSNNVVDHCSATWSVDENVSPGYDAVDTTISNCLIAEALDDASHHKGPHSMGVLVGDRSVGNAIYGNVFAHNKRRNPRLKADSESVVVNNLVYDFEVGAGMGATGTAVVEGNAYLGPNGEHNITAAAQDGQQPDAYIADNVSDGDNEMTNGFFDRLDARPFWPGGLETIPGGDVEAHCLRNAGARPADRTDHDRRILGQVEDRAGSYVDSQADVGGYPDLEANAHSLSVPDSGLRDWLDRWALAVEEPDVDPP